MKISTRQTRTWIIYSILFIWKMFYSLEETCLVSVLCYINSFFHMKSHFSIIAPLQLFNSSNIALIADISLSVQYLEVKIRNFQQFPFVIVSFAVSFTCFIYIWAFFYVIFQSAARPFHYNKLMYFQFCVCISQTQNQFLQPSLHSTEHWHFVILFGLITFSCLEGTIMKTV